MFFLSISISSRLSELFSSSLTGYQSYLHTSVNACSLATALLTDWEPTHRNQVEMTSQNNANLCQSSFEFRDVSEIFHRSLNLRSLCSINSSRILSSGLSFQIQKASNEQDRFLFFLNRIRKRPRQFTIILGNNLGSTGETFPARALQNNFFD